MCVNMRVREEWGKTRIEGREGGRERGGGGGEGRREGGKREKDEGSKRGSQLVTV